MAATHRVLSPVAVIAERRHGETEAAADKASGSRALQLRNVHLSLLSVSSMCEHDNWR